MSIVVIASFAEDHFERNGTTSILPGGPAYYIQNALRSLSVEPIIYSGSKPAIVSIALIDGEERGKLVEVKPILIPKRIQADAIIVSTVDQEFALQDLPEGIRFTLVDLQGYLRSAKGKEEISSQEVWKKISCVKVTEEEFEKLPAQLREEQKQRELIITRGSQSVTVWEKGIAYQIPVRPVVVTHALGAGDRFVAAYAVARYRGDEPEKAAEFAADFVSKSLSEQ
ncbi:MAG: hypothetical protein ACD_48C00011G0002 [uncultured bacterium]|uniref:Carbohydrate kinase PfkB domain-containing protein n=1 Tax=Candidatus Uhrbacteria bacterium RIFOXYB2_FULL_45_11 TaxID=1802421 RepID=A0A1F7W8K4_9BACT|nr:MAG: hypothetical protein ACD_48C00011G0002 [uncultured bacterium]OGL99131.1 MAG: hypothetical protein A2318_02380 [Candidatus Uhrbacteria bacterium RIFOXYB2_FULL_45_11]